MRFDMLRNADGQNHRNDRSKSLGNGGDGERYRYHEGVENDLNSVIPPARMKLHGEI